MPSDPRDAFPIADIPREVRAYVVLRGLGRCFPQLARQAVRSLLSLSDAVLGRLQLGHELSSADAGVSVQFASCCQRAVAERQETV